MIKALRRIILVLHPENLIIWMLFFIPIAHSDFFADAFTVFKKTLAMATAALAAVLISQKKHYFTLNSRSAVILIGICVLRLLSVLFHFDSISVRTLYEDIGFLIIGFYFFNEFLENREALLNKMVLPFVTGILAVLSKMYLQWNDCREGAAPISTECFTSYFGNINMLTEYLILTLPFLLYAWKKQSHRMKNIAMGLIFTAVVVALWLGQSRSTFISFIFLLLFGFVLKQIRLKEICFILFAVAVIGFLTFSSINQSEFDDSSHLRAMQDKSDSTASRRALLYGSLAYLSDSPLGDGPGHFEYGYIPFGKFTDRKPEQREVFLQPHNELLRWGIESGWAYLSALMISSVFLIYLFLRMKIESDLRFLMLGSVAALGPQLLFQFPLENGFSFIWIALVCGLFFSFFSVGQKKLSSFWIQLLRLASIFLLLFGSGFLFSNYLEFHHHKNLKYSRLACLLDPTNARACSNQIENELDAKNISLAIELAAVELRKRPFNFVALRYFMIANIELNNVPLGCDTGKVLHQMFENKTDLEEYLKQTCGGTESPLKPFDSASSYKKSYRVWLDSALINI